MFEGKLPPSMHADLLIDAPNAEGLKSQSKRFLNGLDFQEANLLFGQDITKVHRGLASEYRLFLSSGGWSKTGKTESNA